MKTRFRIYRHAEAQANVDGRVLGNLESPLTEKGRDQAGALAETLVSSPPARLYSSPSGRVKETAEIVAARIGMDVIVDDRLQERFVGAAIQPKLHAEIRPFIDAEYERTKRMTTGERLAHRYSITPDAETGQQAADRFGSFIEEKAQEHAGDEIVVITHAAVLGNFLISRGLMEFGGPFGPGEIAHTQMFCVEYDPKNKRVTLVS